VSRVTPCELPKVALLNRYKDEHYTDCFSADIDGNVSHQDYVENFYRTWLFKSERLILKWAVSKPSTDEQVGQLARGDIDAFAAWTVEDRAENQLLLCDFRGKTRSWLMVEPANGEGAAHTRLYFGSAVISTGKNDDSSAEMGSSFKLLLGLHKLYSKALLKAVLRRLRNH